MSHAECCVCYNASQTFTQCGHCLCGKCRKALLKKASTYSCPYCRSANIHVDADYFTLKTVKGREVRAERERFTASLFQKPYRDFMERQIGKKYSNFYAIYKYASILKVGEEFWRLEDLDASSKEYIFFCNVIDLPISKTHKEFMLKFVEGLCANKREKEG